MKLYIIKTKTMANETPLEWIDDPRGLVTEEQIMSELKDIIYWAPDKVHFIFRARSSLVDVLIWESLAYRINKNMYKRLMEEDKAEWGSYPFKNLYPKE